MIRQLTASERQSVAAIAIAVIVVGLAMAALGGSDPLAVHGVIVMLLAGGLLYSHFVLVLRARTNGRPRRSYYDDPIKVGIALSMAWAVFGMFMGVWVAAQLAWPDLAFDAAGPVSAGFDRRIRPA